MSFGCSANCSSYVLRPYEFSPLVVDHSKNVIEVKDKWLEKEIGGTFGTYPISWASFSVPCACAPYMVGVVDFPVAVYYVCNIACI